jgi:heat shock protein HslJ
MTRTTSLVLAALLIAAVFVAACSTAGAPGGSGEPSGLPEPAGLEGRTFLSTEIKGADLVPDTRVRLSFQDGNLNANAGCNHLGATYTLTDGRLRASQLSMTEMGCDQPLMQQDQWLAAFLGDVGVTLDGDTVTLTDGAVTLTLLDEEVATPDQPIEGTRWFLDGLISGDAVSSVPADVVASLQIADGRANLEAGCNSGGGSVEVTDGKLAFGPIATTKMACGPDAMSVETAVLTVLSGDVSYTIDADRLTINADGVGLTFRAAP